MIPQYRFNLKARILLAGFKTSGQFAENFGLDPSQVSRVITGREIPKARVETDKARGLKLSISEFRELL